MSKQHLDIQTENIIAHLESFSTSSNFLSLSCFQNMHGVELIQIADKEIIYINYSGCNPKEMIVVFDQAKEMVLTKNGNCLLLTNFQDSYITPLFMQHVRKEMPKVDFMIRKNAFIGMSAPQKTILEGFRLFIGNDHYSHFDSRQKAIDYLINDVAI